MHAGHVLIVAREDIVDRGPGDGPDHGCRLRRQLLAQHDRQAGGHPGDEAGDALPGDGDAGGEKAQIGRIVIGHGAGAGKNADAVGARRLIGGVEAMFGGDALDRPQKHRRRDRKLRQGRRQPARPASSPECGGDRGVQPVTPVGQHAPRRGSGVEGALKCCGGRRLQPVLDAVGQAFQQVLGRPADKRRSASSPARSPTGAAAPARQGGPRSRQGSVRSRRGRFLCRASLSLLALSLAPYGGRCRPR